MKYETYQIESTGSALTYEFHSVGPKGRIRKQVQYQQFSLFPDIYNLELSDLNEDAKFDTMHITNNGDTTRILSTVALTALKLFKQRPGCSIYFKGNTKVKTRLYRIAMSRNYDIINEGFDLFGLVNNEWCLFEKDVDYEAFIVKKKA